MIMGDNYSFLYFSDSAYDVDSSGIDNQLGSGASSFFVFFHISS